MRTLLILSNCLGTFINGRKSGPGEITYAVTGLKYIGDFLNGQCNGYGKLSIDYAEPCYVLLNTFHPPSFLYSKASFWIRMARFCTRVIGYLATKQESAG